MATLVPELALRRCALAVSVLYDVDLLPGPDGIVLTRAPQVVIGWQECRDAVGSAAPESDPAHQRLGDWLLLRRWLADRPLGDLAERARPIGTPADAPDHPGPGWVRMAVLGGALDLGLGLVGLDPARPDAVLPLPPAVLAAAGLQPGAWWPGAVGYLERMGGLAVRRWQRAPGEPLRPMGDCDVVTLLGSRVLRTALAASAAGMRPVAVPMRTRGWLDLRRIDPAFALAAAAATEPADRGFSRPLLLTADEVVLAPAGGRPQEVALRESAGGC